MALQYGIVTWSPELEVLDGPDPGTAPDRLPAVGRVTFTRVGGAPVMDSDTQVWLTARYGRLDGGVLVRESGGAGVDLAAGYWTATFRVAGLTLPPVTFEVPAGGTVDLADVVPVIVDPVLLAKGDKGDDGPSAYEVAVAEGFVGDEAAWLASLQGEPGDPGPAGGVVSVNGETGAVTLTPADVGAQPAGAYATSTDLSTGLATKVNSSTYTTGMSGKADLVGGLVPTAQLPAIALSNSVTVASQAAMLALTAAQVQPGDLAVRTDGAGTFILTAPDPSALGNWTRLNAPTDAVVSVNGQSGTVVLAAADLGISADPGASTAGLRTLGTGPAQAKPGNWSPAAATDAAAGIVELATTTEATTGTDTARAVTPAGLKAVGDTKVAATTGEVLAIRKMTQTAYTALGTKVATTLYVIVG